MQNSQVKKIAIIGGGASGFFASLRCAEVARQNKRKVDIRLFESTGNYLRKVKISGGGRCNVTHHEFEVKRFCANYPRGQRELLSPFQQFQAADTKEWFKARGVQLKYEADGRMFPSTDSSQTIINCFLEEAKKYGIKLCPSRSVKSIKKLEDGKISLYFKEGETFVADAVLIATGSSPAGYKLAKTVGHSISELAPSLFTFKIQDVILEGLAGTSFPNTSLNLKIAGEKDFKQSGPLLITHWGLSGPALLKLSAWAAREMMHTKYQAKIFVNWLGFSGQDKAEEALRIVQQTKPKVLVSNAYPGDLTKRFWQQLVLKCEIPADKRWADISKKEFNRLAKNLFSCELEISGKSRFKEEFVECGGINLKEINFKTMESKLCPGLYFSGEIMDIDGVTGGFNFQHAWTSGWIAGSHMGI